MVKRHFPILGSLILATIFGVFGQDLAYFLNDMTKGIYPVYYLTGLTAACILLYLLGAVFIYVYKRKRIIGDISVYVYILSLAFAGGPVLLWALFVTVMWWG